MSAVNVNLVNNSDQEVGLRLDDETDAERIEYFEKATRRGDYKSIDVVSAGKKGKTKDEGTTIEPKPEDAFNGNTVAELTDIIATRNAERADDEKIVPEGTKKAELIAALVKDDALGRLTNKFSND